MPDQESINGQLRLLETYRQRLRIQLDQLGRLGAFAPAYMQTEIDDARANIQKIKGYLRKAGVAVDDAAEDGDQPAPAQTTPTPPKPVEPPDPSTAPADVYISYHPADKGWVRSTLLPLIEQNGLRALVDWRDFELGVPKITNMENAVANSRQTLLVLTPEWVASEWNIFQELLVSSNDPSGVRRKLLPVMLRPCTPPARLALRETADLTDPAERDDQLRRVVRALRGQPKAVNDAVAVLNDDKTNSTSAPTTSNSATSPASSMQSAMATVPNFVGKKINGADTAWSAAGFSGSFNENPGSGSGNWTIQRQSHPPGSSIRATESITVYGPDTASGNSVSTPRQTPATADFVIVTALEDERDAVLDKLSNAKRHAPSGDIRVYYTADLPVQTNEGTATYRLAIVSLLGMGRVEAANATSDAIRRWNPQHIIMVGIAGGVGAEGVKLGDVLISNQVADYELQKITADGPQVRWNVYQVNQVLLSAVSNFRAAEWVGAVTQPRPEPGTPKRHIGPIASGDKVIAFGQALAQYQSAWPKLIGVEMEAGGVAKAAFQRSQPPGFFMVRGVSDLADEHKGDDWRAYACDVAATFTIELLKSGLVPIQ